MTYALPLEPLGSRVKLKNGIFGAPPNMMMTTSKQSLRNTLRKKRNALSASTQSLFSQKIARRFLSDLAFIPLQKMAAYWPIGREVDTRFILEKAQALGKDCYLPAMHPSNSKQLLFLRYEDKVSLKKNRFGILEPDLTKLKPILPWALDLVLVPLLAFDEQGHRLGTGAGCYDYTFSFMKEASKPKHPILIGLAYEFQQVKQLPQDNWDIPLSGILTEERFIFFPGRDFKRSVG